MTFRDLLTLSCMAAVALVGCADIPDDDRGLEPYQGDAGTDAAEFDDANTGDVAEPDAGEDVDDNGGSFDAAPVEDTDNGEDDAGNGDVCQPSGDDMVHRDTFPIEVGQTVPYAYGFDVAVDTAGDEIDGVRTWDFSDVGDDEIVEDFDVEDPDDYWFGEEFPSATYAAELTGDDDDDELGLFELTDDALLLLGVATPDDGFYRTELTYDPPVTMLDFPIEEGKTWTTETEASGSYSGNHMHSHEETYTAEVDATGEVVTPYGTFDALRVNTHLERGYWGAFGWTTEELRTHTFVAECFGSVARVRSHENEEDEEFDQAAELMRIAQ